MVFPVVMYGCKRITKELMLLNCGVGGDSWESLGLQGDPTSQSWRKSVQNIHWKDWCWGWNSNTLATWCKELTPWKRSWSWERLKAGGEGYDRGWDGWMASPSQWTWVWASSGSWRWTWKPGTLLSIGLQSVGHDWRTKLNWTDQLCNHWAYHWLGHWQFRKGSSVGLDQVASNGQTIVTPFCSTQSSLASSPLSPHCHINASRI